MKPRIGFDIDGVLANFSYAFTKLGSDMLHLPIFPGPAFQDDYSFGYDREDHNILWEHIHAHPEFWKNIPPLATSEEFERIEQLCHACEVYFVTSRPGGAAVDCISAEWLESYLGKEAPFTLISCGSTPAKKIVLKNLKLRWHIDDHPDLVGYPDVLVITYPYNFKGPYFDPRYVPNLSTYLGMVENLVGRAEEAR